MGKRGRPVAMETLVSRLVDALINIMRAIAGQSSQTAPVTMAVAPKAKSKRGRPKGSKNSPKSKVGRPKGKRGPGRPPKAKRGRPVGSKNKKTAAVTATSTSDEPKAKRGRPKGSKNKVTAEIQKTKLVTAQLPKVADPAKPTTITAPAPAAVSAPVAPVAAPAQ